MPSSLSGWHPDGSAVVVGSSVVDGIVATVVLVVVVGTVEVTSDCEFLGDVRRI